jgi:DNA-directed RNA polymerase specialized sigma24 family protein
VADDSRADGGSEFPSEFVEFYRREYPGALRLASLLTGSPVVGEDLTQDAFLAVARRFSQLRSPSSYLRTVIVNRARRAHRDRLIRGRRLALLGVAGDSYLPPDTVGVVELVAALPFRQRVVVVGRYWAGWSEAEIAGVLGCRPGTVKSLGSRALARLKKRLEVTDD